ncbi:MAG: enoyl-CoA hydratase-related protein [Legionella sp.]
MSNCIVDHLENNILLLSLNRPEKCNALDQHTLTELQLLLDHAQDNPEVRVIILKGNGHHFCAGADLAWMRTIATFNEAENLADAQHFAQVMHKLYRSNKPTIAMVHGSAFGGGAGLVAACDIAIAATSARFCFSEVKLGLIPAVISPYVSKAIGARNATALFISAEVIDSQRAKELHLIHHCVPDELLLNFTMNYAQKITLSAPLAIQDSKQLMQQIVDLPIDSQLIELTAATIAKKRSSKEGQHGLQAFLNKEEPKWS